MYPYSPVKKYSRDEVSKAIVIHCQGSKAYEAIRRDPRNVMPLPHPKTLNRYISNFLCSPGLHPELFSILGAKLSSMDVIGRQSMIVFDEMHVKECIEYDHWLKRVMGPHKTLQLVMIREQFMHIL